MACILVAAAPAYGKGDVRATLENPMQLQRAVPGERVRIAWTLTEAQLPPLTAPGRVAPRPFGASGVYIRVRGKVREPPEIFAANSGPLASRAGRYAAVVTVPSDGIAAIAIGLEGYRTLPGQASTRADVFFPIANDPFTVANASVATTSSAAGASAPWIPLAAGLAVLGMLLAWYRTRVTRRTA
jgi:hypothetical protein